MPWKRYRVEGVGGAVETGWMFERVDGELGKFLPNDLAAQSFFHMNAGEAEIFPRMAFLAGGRFSILAFLENASLSKKLIFEWVELQSVDIWTQLSGQK